MGEGQGPFINTISGPVGGGMGDASASACVMPPRVEQHPRRPYESSVIDILENCHRLELLITMNEYERKHQGLSHRIETWPQSVRIVAEQQLLAWQKDKAGIDPVAITTAIYRGSAVVVLHWIKP